LRSAIDGAPGAGSCVAYAASTICLTPDYFPLGDGGEVSIPLPDSGLAVLWSGSVSCMTDRVDGTHADEWCRERVVAELCDPRVGLAADLSTIRFEREVVAGSHQAIHALVGQAEGYASRPRVGDQRQHFAFFFETEHDRWSLTSWIYVGDGEGLPGRGPRALLGGGVDADGLNAAGRVFTDGHDSIGFRSVSPTAP
jgi:hypothetical protein